MDERTRMLRVIYGTQESSLEYIKRFSMCDCLTLLMPSTYTAMGAGLDLFLKKFEPSKKIMQPYANSLSDVELKKLRPVAYKIPQKIDTFLWSPFHDATSTHWNFPNDNVDYAWRFKGQILRNLGLCTQNKTNHEKLWRQQLREMDQKITDMWGDVCKILVYYDASRLQNGPTKKRLGRFRKLSRQILDWPLIRIRLTNNDAKNKADSNKIKRWSGWDHYSPKTRNIFYERVEAIEHNFSCG